MTHSTSTQPDSRLPDLPVTDLTPGQRELYDVFVSGPRQSQAGFFPVSDADGRLSGPYHAMLLSPALGAPLERLGRAVRYEGTLAPRLRELVILTVARLNESEVEWRAHEALALSEGVPHATVTSLRSSTPKFESDLDALVHEFTVSLLAEHLVSDELFHRLEEVVGTSQVFEVVATAGYYQIIAHINNAFGLVP
jgi:4-carboxymuconolactone decarboxylase